MGAFGWRLAEIKIYCGNVLCSLASNPMLRKYASMDVKHSSFEGVRFMKGSFPF